MMGEFTSSSEPPLDRNPRDGHAGRICPSFERMDEVFWIPLAARLAAVERGWWAAAEMSAERAIADLEQRGPAELIDVVKHPAAQAYLRVVLPARSCLGFAWHWYDWDAMRKWSGIHYAESTILPCASGPGGNHLQYDLENDRWEMSEVLLDGPVDEFFAVGDYCVRLENGALGAFVDPDEDIPSDVWRAQKLGRPMLTRGEMA